ncbi:hypothetical protein RCO28_34595 [Streptomyces sp. LHD-70]|uniref:DNA polymerase Y family protein n=1 Tax=Streptomyces sp. LHD-70 TaxID=3072140 RepID=UPI00280C5A20|nr:hypothetical protein [Streptomyces sp. LHD-70]MDQ8707563.1 hypothetical protein [Streptomyces sp. LHD-70]
MHVRVPIGLPEPTYREVLEVLSEVSPVVQAVPPGAAVVELRGALRYFGVPPLRLAETIRVRSLARLSVDLRIGLAPTWAVAATASALAPEHGGIVLVEPDQVSDFLAPLPVEAVHGIGPMQARALNTYGIHTVAALAAMPLGTVQRLLGGRAGRVAAERARGVDPRPVTPKALPMSAAVRHRFAQQELDGAAVRARLLDLVVELASTLRRREQIARGLTLQLDFAAGTRWSKTLRLSEPSAHDEDLRTAAYRLMDAAGLQRGRLTGLLLRADDLVGAHAAAEQITFDRGREMRLRVESVADRANARYGKGTVGPASLLRKAA